VAALGDLLDQLVAERGQVVGLAAGDQARVHDDVLVNPGGAGVAQVGLQARPRRQRPAAYHVGLDQRPRRVADGCDRLAGGEEAADEVDGVLVQAQRVRVRHPAGQDQPGVVVDVGGVEGGVHLERVGLVEVVEGLDLAGLGRDQPGRAACLLDGLPRLGELDLLDALGRDGEGDGLALKRSTHEVSS
jgi:hypothetical protein